MVQYCEDRIFRALADPTRRSMLEHLDRGPMSVSELAEPLAISLTAVTRHVGRLESAGLVTTTKTGRTRTCAVDRDGLAHAGDWIAQRRALWERRTDRLERHLDTRRTTRATDERHDG